MSRFPVDQLDCLFVFPPAGENAENYFFYSIGSAYIISFLRSNGYAAEQFLCKDFLNLDDCVRKILKQKARVVGFTVFNSNFLTSVLIAEHLKKASPETIVAFGGSSATTYSEFILSRYPFVDICFRNESEETFLQFISQLSDSQSDFKKIDKVGIKGITYRDGNEICKNPECNILISNSRIPNYLDRYPSPYLSSSIPVSAAFSIGVITGRGCNQNCIYCNCAVLSKRRFFTHSVERVIGELDFISRYKGKNNAVNIFDDAFSLIPLRAKAICRAIIENRIKISLSCITRCDCVDEELLDLMKEAGFIIIGFSLESANPRSLRAIGKVHKAEDDPSDGLEKELQFLDKFGKAVTYAKKIGINKIFSSIMLGLPNETLEEANRTIETIEKFPAIDFYSHNFLNIYQGTPIFSNYRKYGYKIELYDNNPIFSTTVYPDERIEKLKILFKSQTRKRQNDNDINVLKILSLHPDKKSARWFNNIILLSDTVGRNFVEWLKDILAINGTLVNIYSDRNAMLANWKSNYEELIKWSSPTLKILNYYIEKNGNTSRLISHNSAVYNILDKEDDISICDFDFTMSNLHNSETDFVKMVCRESSKDDSASFHDYLLKASKQNNLFNSLVNSKPFPYFANLCRWTKDLANCHTGNTLLVNDKGEARLCWHGKNIGMTGQPMGELHKNLEYDRNKTAMKRKCGSCTANDYCIKCADPRPFTDEEYCMRQKSDNLTETAGLFMSFDMLKQLM